jgi:Cu-Zn family superoxide dismutase
MPRRLLATLMFLSAATLAAAQVADDRTAYPLPGDGTFPEGIAYAPELGAFFVTGAGSGAIYRVDLASGDATTVLEPGLRAGFTTIGATVAGTTLWVAGGGSGEVLRFDGVDAASFDAAAGPSRTYPSAPAEATFFNDLVVAPDGTVYVTDSNRPALFHVAPGTDEATVFVDFAGTPFAYVEGFNANGIAITPDGGTLVVVQANTGLLFRIDVATRAVAAIDLAGATVPGGDGLVLDGTTLFVVQNGADQVAVIELAADLTTGTLTDVLTDERLSSAATAALVGDRLLVTNAQFGMMQTGATLPFEVLVLPVD